MSCRRMTVKDVMQTMRGRVKRQLTVEERKLAQVTAQQTTAFICTAPTKKKPLGRSSTLKAAAEPASEAERKLLDFAWKMKRIPRKALRDDVYPDTVRAVVDQPKAKAAFKKAFPTASSSMVYQAINILQERLDDRPNT